MPSSSTRASTSAPSAAPAPSCPGSSSESTSSPTRTSGPRRSAASRSRASRRSSSTTVTVAICTRTGSRPTHGRRTDGPGGRAGAAAPNRGGAPEDRHVVDAAARGRRRARLVPRLLDVGGHAERALLRAAVSVAVLLAVSLSLVPPSFLRLRTPRHPSAGHRVTVSGLSDPLRARPVPAHVLLLPEGLLPLVLARAGGVRRPRREDGLLG